MTSRKYGESTPFEMKLQQETPIIKVLEPPVVPNKKSEPKKANIVLVFLVNIETFLNLENFDAFKFVSKLIYHRVINVILFLF